MSKYQLTRVIQKELLAINHQIDQNIIYGRSYIKEAARHKMLLRQLRQYQKPLKSNLSASLWGFINFAQR